MPIPVPTEGRYYARFAQGERIEPAQEGPARLALYFEAFDAKWFDDQPAVTPETRFDFYLRAPLALLELMIDENLVESWLPFWGELMAFTWLEIYSSGPNDGPVLSVYPNLFSEGPQRSLVKAFPAGEERSQRLNQAVSLDDVPDATDEKLDQTLGFLANEPRAHAVAFDVGQGNALGFFDEVGVVELYFDLGGGVGRNAFTFPKALRSFCFTAEPPIILSHWDHDHWSSALRFPNALDQTWIAPRQTIGPIHAAFAAQILVRGRLLLLPHGFPGRQFGDLYLERCIGPDRNDGGLALTWRNPEKTEEMLLPADARYRFVASAAGKSFHSVVAPHHGALPKSPIPVSMAHLSSRLVYSYGPGNSYCHPHPTTRSEHDKAGWVDPSLRTDAYPLVRNTADRGPSGLGHVLLSWEPMTHPPTSPCGSTQCQLTPTQF